MDPKARQEVEAYLRAHGYNVPAGAHPMILRALYTEATVLEAAKLNPDVQRLLASGGSGTVNKVLGDSDVTIENGKFTKISTGGIWKPILAAAAVVGTAGVVGAFVGPAAGGAAATGTGAVATGTGVTATGAAATTGGGVLASVGGWAGVAGLAGTGIQVISQLKQGAAAEQAAKDAGAHQRAAAESQAQLAEFNAAVADLQAKDAIAVGAEEESRFRTQIRVAIGAQRAGFAASHVDVGYGSPVDVQADAAYLGELDALQLRHNAERTAWGFRMTAEDLRARAVIARKEGVFLEAAGNAYQSGAGLAAAGTLLGSGASLLQQRYGFKNSGSASPTVSVPYPGYGVLR